jgi:hypothetical protein
MFGEEGGCGSGAGDGELRAKGLLRRIEPVVIMVD